MKPRKKMEKNLSEKKKQKNKIQKRPSCQLFDLFVGLIINIWSIVGPLLAQYFRSFVVLFKTHADFNPQLTFISCP
jgi:hypothetical protein